MTKARLEEIVDFHGLKIDGYRGGAGKFRDLEIGIGAGISDLTDLVNHLKKEGISWANVTRTTNPNHEDFNKPYVEIGSFWWE